MASASATSSSTTSKEQLFKAAEDGDRSTLQALLAASTPVDLESKHFWDDQTALHAAARQGHAACVSLLLQAGAKLGGAATNDGSTPLARARRYGHATVVAILQGTSRWRRRRALALIREQREAGSDWRKARKVWKHSAALHSQIPKS